MSRKAITVKVHATAKAIFHQFLVNTIYGNYFDKWGIADPKGVDLYVGRLKPLEMVVEDRNCANVQIAGPTCV